MQNLKINNTEQGIRIKSTNSRGGVVEDVWADNIQVGETKNGIGSAENSAFQVDLTYDAAVVASDEFFLYDYPPGSKPKGKGADLARQLKNQLYDYLQDCHYCQP